MTDHDTNNPPSNVLLFPSPDRTTPHHTFGHPAPIYPNPMTRRQARMIATALNAFLDVSEQLVLVALIGETGDSDNISAITSFILKEQSRLGPLAPLDAPAWRQHLHLHLMDLMCQNS